MTVVTEQQQQDPSGGVQQRQPMQQLAAAALAQVALCRNSGLLTSSCLSTQKRRQNEAPVCNCQADVARTLYRLTREFGATVERRQPLFLS
ncbi:TPA: hypothetical protein ACH3X1_015701 [Trebouxia sp. C0004]